MRITRLSVAALILILLFAGPVTAQQNLVSREDLERQIRVDEELRQKLAAEAEILSTKVEALHHYHGIIGTVDERMEELNEQWWNYLKEHEIKFILYSIFRDGTYSNIPELEPVNREYYELERLRTTREEIVNEELKNEVRFGRMIRNVDELRERIFPLEPQWVEELDSLMTRIARLDTAIAENRDRLNQSMGQVTSSNILIGFWKLHRGNKDQGATIEISRTPRGELFGWLRHGSLTRFSSGQTMWTNFKQQGGYSPVYSAWEEDREGKGRTIRIVIIDENTLNYNDESTLYRSR